MNNYIVSKAFGAFYKVFIKPFSVRFNKKVSSQIPKYELSEIHIKNTKLLTTREELLKLLPKGGVVAELGVDEGGFSEKILKLTQPEKLHLIDYWGTKRYNVNKRNGVELKFKNLIQNNKVEINLGYSTDVVKEFDDNYFDWIYIDTTHLYKTTIDELVLYHKKIKPNGIIAGHDYILGNWDGIVRYGVIEAVYEFCVKYNWEIIYITAELQPNPSFAIRKIG